MENIGKDNNNYAETQIGQIEKKIVEAIQIQDEEKRKNEIKKILLELQNFFKNENYREFYQKRNLVDGMNIDLCSKLKFFMIASKISYTCYEKFGDDRMLSFLVYNPYIIEEKDFFDFCFKDVTIDFYEFCPEFLEKLNEDEELQKMFSTYFKEVYCFNIRDQYLDLSFFSNLPWFQRIVLTDEKFVCNVLGEPVNADNYYSIFSTLPRGYEYLISLYGGSRGLQELYYTHFYNIFKKSAVKKDGNGNDEIDGANEAICDFFDLQENDDNPYRIDRYHRVRKIKEALKNVLMDNEFYPNLKLIQKKANLSFKSVVAFAYKYYGTDFYKVLLKYLSDAQELSPVIEEKIQYLAKSGKKEDIERLADIDTVSLNQLKEMKRVKRDKSETINSEVMGGPNSRTNIHFMPDSDDSDIIAIFPDGREKTVHCKGTQRKSFFRIRRGVWEDFWFRKANTKLH